MGLGANLGNREGRLAEALTRLEATDGIHVAAVSHVYATAPWGVTLQPDFLNICIRIETALAPFDLLRICKYIERAMGRKARAQWGPREIDVDVLLVEGAEIDSEELTLPHPRLTARRFVLEPLCDVAPDWQVQGRNIADLAAALRASDPAQACEIDAAATTRLQTLFRP